MLENLPGDRSERWKLVRQIAALYCAPNNDRKELFKDGRSKLNNLSFSIPVALREWYELTEQVTDLWSGQDILLEPQNITVKNGYLIFFAENQWCWEVGISIKDLELSDPPVYIIFSSSEHEVLSTSVSQFCLQSLLCQTAWSGRSSRFSGATGIDKNVIEKIEKTFIQCDLPDLYLWSDQAIRFFEHEGIFLRLDYDNLGTSGFDYAYWWIMAQNEYDLIKVLDILKSFGAEIEEN